MVDEDVIDARFEVQDLAGSGGMADVYRAIDRVTSQPVALKVLRQSSGYSAPSRFAREAEILAELHHEGIVGYVTHGHTGDGLLYLAIEWVDGEDLLQRLRRGRLSIVETLVLGRRVAEALGVAHAVGIVHRDIKPSNLILPKGRIDKVKVLDFGIARIDNARALTRTGHQLGTPGYVAPEQARGQKEIGPHSDVFALGCVLFECITGKAAFVGDSVWALLAKILLEEAPRTSEVLRNVPPELDDLIARMLAKDPVQRPLDGSVVAKELKRVYETYQSMAVEATVDVVPRSSHQRDVIEAALTQGEQRLVCVVLGALGSTTTETDVTMALGDASSIAEKLHAVVVQGGGRFEHLADGSVLALFSGTTAATDLAARAARSALALSALAPSMPLSLATGRGVLTGRWPVGEAIDRAASLLPMARPGTIRLHDLTAALLSARFDVRAEADGLTLYREMQQGDVSRTLLGKATPYVGRDKELRALQEMLQSCIQEPCARAMLVTAQAGIGKSRLVREFVQRLEQQGEALTIWMGRGDAMTAGSAFGMIAPVLRRAAGILDGEPLAVRRRKFRTSIALRIDDENVDRLTAFLGELVGIAADDAEGESGASGWRMQLLAARRDPMLMGDQMRRAWEDLLMAETSIRPVLLVLDDLQWGDLPSVTFIDSALRNLHDRPLMVLALARPEVHDMFPRLWEKRGLETLHLGGLSRKGSERLIRQILGNVADSALIGRLVERSNGNAFYLEELIRAAAAGQSDAWPETVVAMVEARIEALDPDARRLLRAASIFGHVFWEHGALALLGGSFDNMHDLLTILVDLEIITPQGEIRFPGHKAYAFRHAFFREAAYAMLTDEDRALGHRLAGSWLEAQGESEAIILAEHFERGQAPDRAVSWYGRAAEQALGGNDFASAIARAEGAVRCGAQGETLGVLRRLQAEAHGWLGEMEEAAARGRDALGLLAHGSVLWCSAAGEVALAVTKLGQYDLLEQLFEDVNLVREPDKVEASHLVIWAQVAYLLFVAGRRTHAQTLLHRLEALIDEASHTHGVINEVVMGFFSHARSWAAVYEEDVAASLRWEEAAVKSFEQAGDLRNACHALAGLGVAYREVGAFVQAEMALRDALTAAERLGLSRIKTLAMHNLGLVLAIRGDLEEACRVEQHAVDAFAAERDARLESAARIYLAMIFIYAGRLDDALREATLASKITPQGSEVHTMVLSVLAKAQLALGQPHVALESAQRAMAYLSTQGQLEEGDSRVRVVYAETLYATGHLEQAKAAILDARARILVAADKIREPEWRRSFLEHPDNARTLFLASAWDPDHLS